MSIYKDMIEISLVFFFLEEMKSHLVNQQSIPRAISGKHQRSLRFGYIWKINSRRHQQEGKTICRRYLNIIIEGTYQKKISILGV
jgi:hypothetical protein